MNVKGFKINLLILFAIIFCLTDGTEKAIVNKEEHLLHAAAQGNLVELKRAITAGADIHNTEWLNGNSAVMWAAVGGYIEIIQALLTSGADIDQRSKDGQKNALMLAVYKGHYAVVEYLISKGANLDAKNERGDSSLSIASYMGHKDLVALLLDRSTTTLNDQTNALGYSALHFSCYKGHLEVTRLLVLADAVLDARDESGKTPLMLASLEGHADIVRYLLAHDADADAQDKSGNTALLLALSVPKGDRSSGSSTVDCVHALLNEKCLIDQRNNEGHSPLMLAAAHGFSEIVTLLLESGADCSAVDKQGESAISLAQKSGSEVISAILKSHSKCTTNRDTGDSATEIDGRSQESP